MIDQIAYRPGEIPWEPAAADGTRGATLVGRRLPGEQFSCAFSIPAGVWDAPHSHPVDAHIVVVSGVLRLGYGTTVDVDSADPYPVGSYLFVSSWQPQTPGRRY